jgi:hypothetical protein
MRSRFSSRSQRAPLNAAPGAGSVVVRPAGWHEPVRLVHAHSVDDVTPVLRHDVEEVLDERDVRAVPTVA